MEGDGQLFNFGTVVQLLHGIDHVELHVLGQLVDLHIPGIPQLQGVIAVDGVGTNLLVQVPDIVEDAVDFGGGLHQTALLVFVNLRQLFGGVVEQAADRGGGGVDQVVMLGGVRELHQVAQGVFQLAQLGLDHTEVVLAPAHLVEDMGDLVQAVEHGLVVAHSGVVVAVADIQIGVPQLGDVIHNRAVADVHIVLVLVAGGAHRVHRALVHPLPGVAQGIDVADIIACHLHSGLGGMDAQDCGAVGSKGTDNCHLNSPLSIMKKSHALKSAFFRGASSGGIISPPLTRFCIVSMLCRLISSALRETSDAA